MIDDFISEHSKARLFHSMIDSRLFNYTPAKREQVLARVRQHVASILRDQDGDSPQRRTLAERKNLYIAGAK